MKVALVVFALCFSVASAEQFTVEDCVKDVEAGPIGCKANFPVYMWDVETKQCESTIYGGCNPTNNMFWSLEDCESIARPICEVIWQ
nr:unnamed protein product [Callosobruchus analis]